MIEPLSPLKKEGTRNRQQQHQELICVKCYHCQQRIRRGGRRCSGALAITKGALDDCQSIHQSLSLSLSVFFFFFNIIINV